MTDAIVIVGAARTPMGSFQGDFASLAAHDMGGVASLCIGCGEATAVALEML